MKKSSTKNKRKLISWVVCPDNMGNVWKDNHSAATAFGRCLGQALRVFGYQRVDIIIGRGKAKSAYIEWHGKPNWTEAKVEAEMALVNECVRETWAKWQRSEEAKEFLCCRFRERLQN